MSKKRSIKVYGQSGYKYREIPTIMLKGMWLKKAGFDVGNYISVTCEDGKIVIAKDTERAAINQQIDNVLVIVQQPVAQFVGG